MATTATASTAAPRGAAALVWMLAAVPALAADPPAPARAPRTMGEVLAATTAADWRPLDPENTLYLQLAAGPGRHRAGARVRAAARGNISHARPREVLRRPRDRPLAGQLRRAVGRSGRQAQPRRRRSDGCRRNSRSRVDRPAVRAAAGRRRLRARGRVQPRVSRPAATRARARPGSPTATQWSGSAAATSSTAATARSCTSSPGMRHGSSTATSRVVGRVVKGMELLSTHAARHRRRWGSTKSPSSTCRSERAARGRRAGGGAREAGGAAHRHRDVHASWSNRVAIAATTGTRCRPVTSICATCRWWSPHPDFACGRTAAASRASARRIADAAKRASSGDAGGTMERIWLKHYPAGVPADVDRRRSTRRWSS